MKVTFNEVKAGITYKYLERGEYRYLRTNMQKSDGPYTPESIISFVESNSPMMISSTGRHMSPSYFNSLGVTTLDTPVDIEPPVLIHTQLKPNTVYEVFNGYSKYAVEIDGSVLYQGHRGKSWQKSDLNLKHFFYGKHTFKEAYIYPSLPDALEEAIKPVETSQWEITENSDNLIPNQVYSLRKEGSQYDYYIRKAMTGFWVYPPISKVWQFKRRPLAGYFVQGNYEINDVDSWPMMHGNFEMAFACCIERGLT